MRRATICGRNFHAPLSHLNRSAALFYGHAKGRPLHHSRKIGCLDSKMRRGLLLNLEDGIAEALHDLRHAAALGLGNGDPAIRRNHQIFSASDKNSTSGFACRDHVARFQCFTPCPRFGDTGTQHIDRSRRFRNCPSWRVRKGRRAAKQRANNH